MTKSRKIILDALAADRAAKKPATHTRHQLLVALKDPPGVYPRGGLGHGASCGTILNYWTPTIIRQAGVSNVLKRGSAIRVAVHHRRARHAGGRTQLGRDAGAALALFFCTLVWRVRRFPAAGAVGQHCGAIICLGMISISYFGAAAIIWSIPPAYLSDDAAAAGIGAISASGRSARSAARLRSGGSRR